MYTYESPDFGFKFEIQIQASRLDFKMKVLATVLASAAVVRAHGWVDNATIGGLVYQVCFLLSFYSGGFEEE